MKDSNYNLYIEIVKSLHANQIEISESSILFLGVCKKKGKDFVPEPAALELLAEAEKNGVTINYHDPHVSEIKSNARIVIKGGDTSEFIPGKIIYKTVPLSAEVLERMDCVVLITNSPKFDEAFIKEHSKLILDIRKRIKKN